ncbi:MAG TPA: hypothetical protein VNT26_12330 [Candidatus Sulfotelmatobacter sp.]|nr:hypothetical protein [Candidatus Sulfotelmatobacter sp.]
MIPPLIPVRQRFPCNPLTDVASAMITALEELALRQKVRPGMRVALTAGSRGIANVALLLRTAAGYLRSLGAIPVVVAAMGSHGGGTAEGQLEVLASLGITPESVGCPVVGGVDVVDLARTAQGLAVFFDRVAAGCDGVLVINRVKAHTSFHGPLESGLVKMLVVGLGKPAGARQFHSLGAQRLSGALAEIGQVILGKVPILGGIAVLEDAREDTAALVSVDAADLISREPELLRRSKALMPRLPVRNLDLLIVDEMGKNISGTGMDTNVIGRVGIHGVPDGEPEIQRIVVLDLSEGSHGNANGMGLADFITERFRRKIDFPATYLNTLTATFVQRARMPIVMESDQAAITTAIQTLGNLPPDRIKAIRIKNTLQLEHIWVSPTVFAEILHDATTEIIGSPAPLQFDAGGRLMTPRE